MKVAAMLVLVLVSAIAAAKADCEKDEDCKSNECCREYLPQIGRCVDKGDEVGDLCGGQFKCGCKEPLRCVEYPHSIWNKVKVGTGKCQSPN